LARAQLAGDRKSLPGVTPVTPQHIDQAFQTKFALQPRDCASDNLSSARTAASLTAGKDFLGFFDQATKISGQNGPLSGKKLPARDYMAFNWQHPIVSRRMHIAHPNGFAWAHAFDIKVLPFLAETSR
jgi:hypothetical protein